MKSLQRLAPVLRRLPAALVLLSATQVMAVELPTVEVYKTLSCGCCGFWVEHMQKSGFKINVHNVRDVTPVRENFGVPDAMASCHTAMVGGYAIEGHVPAADVQRLLRERPKATGIAVPGMVQGSPGMDQGQGKEPYSVILFSKSGRPYVFAQH
ncbi:MAG: DUF411 domain-containing protein [Burkholderiales bacterium]|nr:DUF411 domain-containing protein [Burkholderiales bacterium]